MSQFHFSGHSAQELHLFEGQACCELQVELLVPLAGSVVWTL
jgi:hypothetical protein